jgi:hypothetical protein
MLILGYPDIATASELARKSTTAGDAVLRIAMACPSDQHRLGRSEMTFQRGTGSPASAPLAPLAAAAVAQAAVPLALGARLWAQGGLWDRWP